METKFNLVNLFSIPLIQVNVEEDTDELLSCNDFILSDLQSDNKEMPVNYYRILERYPNIKTILLQYINKALCEYMTYDANFDISTSWLTKTSKGDSCQLHNHRNCFWSGIYYFDEYTENSGKLSLVNPIRFFSSYYIKFKQNSSATAESMTVKPKSKSLILFPSYVEHKILEQNDDNERKSLAFNIIPECEIGGGDSTYNPLWVTEWGNN